MRRVAEATAEGGSASLSKWQWLAPCLLGAHTHTDTEEGQHLLVHLQSHTHPPRNQDGDVRALQGKPRAEAEETLQEAHVSDRAAVVMPVSHWGSSLRIHSSV